MYTVFTLCFALYIGLSVLYIHATLSTRFWPLDHLDLNLHTNYNVFIEVVDNQILFQPSSLLYLEGQ